MPLKGQDPGQLDRRITLQSLTTANNGYDEPIETWTDVATVWANIEYPKTGSGENFYDALEIASTTVIFTIRYRSGINAINRIVYGGFAYDIERIAELGRNNHLAITGKLRQ